MKYKHTFLVVTGVALVLAVAYFGFMFTPYKIVVLEPADVSSIEVENGGDGKQITVTAQKDIEHIIGNLNSIRFRREKLALGYVDFSYKLKIIKNDGELYRELIINSSDTAGYGSFFYRDETGSIDCDYMAKLFSDGGGEKDGTAGAAGAQTGPENGPAALDTLVMSGIDVGLVAHIGKPFGYFSEKYGWSFEEMFYSPIGGPPIGYYYSGSTELTFNNMAGYEGLTESTPCTGISALYTTVLPGVKPNALTEEKLAELFGEYSRDEYIGDRLSILFDGVEISFTLGDTGFQPRADISIVW